ncbi:hypothetical protein AB0A74_14190 [Saccharothrix sp. NPDC042600]|uniref:hypothetical protein n=1 Tax=Saccharothrix TaxID=2071 RepID=UPI0033D5504B|nr:hypothetical protein GCM10017745_22880 [Saccharothrix mutabilis subsp. capreolus]
MAGQFGHHRVPLGEAVARAIGDHAGLDRQKRVMATTPAQAAIAIGLMGGVFTASAAAGARTGKRSPFFQTRKCIRPNHVPRALMWFPIALGTVRGIARLATRVRENTALVRHTGH